MGTWIIIYTTKSDNFPHVFEVSQSKIISDNLIDSYNEALGIFKEQFKAEIQNKTIKSAKISYSLDCGIVNMKAKEPEQPLF